MLHALKHEKAQAHVSRPAPSMILPGIVKKIISMIQTWLMNEAACPPAVRKEPDNMLNLLDIDFWLWYQKVTPKGMAHAFKIKFWEVFSTPGYYDILTEGQYKMPNSNDGCMWLRAATTYFEWSKGTDEDVKILQWLSIHAGITSECIIKQYILLDRLVDVEMQSKPLDNTMVVDEPAKPVAGSSKHQDDVDVVDGELIY